MFDNEKVIDRIRKLLALSESANEHEAASAAEKAAELIREYQINDAELRAKDGKPPEEIIFSTLHVGKNKIQWKMDLATGLTKAFGGKIFVSGGSIVAFAHKTVAQTLQYMASYLYGEIDRLAEQAFLNGAAGSHGKTWKHSFRLGAAEVIYHRLAAIGSTRISETKQIGISAALILRSDQTDLEAAWSRLTASWGKRNKPISRRADINEARAFMAGRRAGESITLNNSAAMRLKG